MVTSAKGCPVPTPFKSQAGRVGEEGWCEPCCFSKASFTELETHPRNVTTQEAGAGTADCWGICRHQELWPQDMAPPTPALLPDHLLGPSATFWLLSAGSRSWDAAAAGPPCWLCCTTSTTVESVWTKARWTHLCPCRAYPWCHPAETHTCVCPKDGNISQHCSSQAEPRSQSNAQYDLAIQWTAHGLDEDSSCNKSRSLCERKHPTCVIPCA